MGIEQGSTLHASIKTMNSTLMLIQNLEAGSLLTPTQAESLMEELLSGRMDTREIVRLLQALNSRPLAAAELAGFARVMRQHAAAVFPAGVALPEKMVDTCGTGGDGSGTFNISTAAAIVASAAGARVAKHGNRSVSSRCGSADVLEVLGIRIDLPLEHAGRSIREIGIGFLFAPNLHPAMRHAAPVRRELRLRTVFNLIGPLANPARAGTQLIGTPSPEAAQLMAEALAALGTDHSFIVHGHDGLDEVTTTGATDVYEVWTGRVEKHLWMPSDFGVKRAFGQSLLGGDASRNAEIARDILAGAHGPMRDIVLVNAAAGLAAGGLAKDLRHGVQLAEKSIDSGAARRKLDALQKKYPVS